MKKIINIKADEEVRDQARAIAAELGLPLSTIVNAYLKEFIRNREVNFSAIPGVTPALEEIIGRAEEDFGANRNVSGPFASPKAAISHLRAAQR